MKKQNKTIKEFSEWLNEEDRQNWEIERYVEELIAQTKRETLKEILKKLKQIQVLADKEQALETDLAIQELLALVNNKKDY